MNECDCFPGYPFFNDKMADRPDLSQIYKKRFCLGGENNSCTRHMVKEALGKKSFPGDLYPNQKERENEIIKK